MDTQRCGGCNETLPLDHFCKNKSALNGRDWHCRKCQSKAKHRRRKAYLLRPIESLAIPVSKTCCRCKITKDGSEFNRDYGRTDSLAVRCRDCDSVKTKKYRQTAASAESDKRSRKGNKKVGTRSSFNTRVKRGKIIKQPCSVCGLTPAEGHHEDYSKPYDVVWLCRKHHAERHTMIRRLEISGKYAGTDF